MYRRKYTRPTPAAVPETPRIEEKQEAQVSPFHAMTLTIPELAKELHICEKTARQLVREPDFPSFNIGKRILINREGLQQWINSRSAQPLSDESIPAA